MRPLLRLAACGAGLTTAAVAALPPAASPPPPPVPLTTALLSHAPGERKPVDFKAGEDPFLDLASSDPGRIEPKSALTPAAALSKAFNSAVQQLKVTGVFLPNEPKARSVVLNRVAFRQGQMLPAEMLTKGPEGHIYVKEITSSTVILEMLNRDGTRSTAALVYSLAFSKNRPRTK